MRLLKNPTTKVYKTKTKEKKKNSLIFSLIFNVHLVKKRLNPSDSRRRSGTGREADGFQTA